MKRIALLLILCSPLLALGQNTQSDNESETVKASRFFNRSSLEVGLLYGTDGELHVGGINAVQYWALGRHRPLKLGAGIRLNSMLGNDNLSYTTAPAALLKDESNIDTVLFEGTQILALNLFLSLRYDITSHWGGEAAFDLAGFSFGAEKKGMLTFDDGKLFPTNATPTAGNYFLAGNKSVGNLITSLFITYQYKSNWRFKLGAMHNLAEYSLGSVARYTTDEGTVLETQRYRAQNWAAGMGVSYLF